MSEPTPIEELMRRIREGDSEAAAELVRLYEPAIRRAVRFRLTDTRLQAAFDSMDICQSVLGSFFVRAASGQFDVDQPQQLRGLLVAMAQKKLAMQVRHQRAQRRDHRRVVSSPAEDLAVRGSDPTPSRQLQARELLKQVQDKLSPEEQQVVNWRNEGMRWEEIAVRVGGTPDGVRMKLTRALDRIAEELKLEVTES